MKRKVLTLCTVAMALTGCGGASDNNPNTRGSVTLQGTPTTGETLTATVSDPDGISSPITYIWYADGERIEGANQTTLLLTDAQIGLSVTVQALYTDDGGTNESHISVATSEVAAIPFDGAVSVQGDAVVGGQLSATLSDENGIENASIAWQWYADEVAITDAVQSTLDLQEEQYGAFITVTAMYSDDRGFEEIVTSEAVGPVSRVNSPGEVTISGTPTVGNTLSAEIEDADGASGQIAYQWYADDVAIDGATESSYVVEEAYIGTVLTVSVSYVDDNGFIEENTSEATIEVASVAVDEPGRIVIEGTKPYLADALLTATITDNNGVEEANVNYIWMADGEVISGTQGNTLIPDNHAGAVISVSASYLDNDGFSDTVEASLDSVIYSQVVTDATGLLAAVNGGLADGSVIGLNSNIYSDLDEISLTSGVQLRAIEEQSPVISGELCIHVTASATNTSINGLTFTDIDTKAGSVCETEEQAVIYSEADNFVFSQNTLSGDQEELNETTHHWLMLKGSGAVIERNTFTGRNHAEKGAVIKLASAGSDHLIQYNLFSNSDNPNFDDSSLLLLNVGSTTGTDSAENSGFTIRYNRVENFVTGRRLMRVQTSGATIHGNTIINANGGISLEDGGFNRVTDNIMIRTTDIASSNDRPSGVLITPLGHTVENNYIAGIRSTNKEAGGLVFTPNPFSQADGGVPNAGNQAILDGTGDLTLSVKNNTVLNSIQPIVFSTEIGSRAPVGDCDELTADNSPVLYSLTKNFFVINFDANLIANGLNDDPLAQGLFLPFDASSSDHTFEYDCDLINHEQSFFSNNFGFSDSYASGDVEDEYWVDIRNMNGNGQFDTDGAVDQDPAANGKEAPDFITASNSLIETNPNGAQSLAGAKGLHYIQANQVGAGSSWIAEED